jgi:hypothetical protein
MNGMSIGSRIEKSGLIDARSRLPDLRRIGDWSPWTIAIAALAGLTVVLALAALVAGEPILLVIAASAWLLALSVYLWTTAES